VLWSPEHDAAYAALERCKDLSRRTKHNRVNKVLDWRDGAQAALLAVGAFLPFFTSKFLLVIFVAIREEYERDERELLTRAWSPPYARSYHEENAGTRSNTEAKPRRAASVLAVGSSWESAVLCASFCC
jgi:hypothetical protein